MSKKQQHDYYYSFTSPPTEEPASSSSSSRLPNPSAPPTTSDSFLPPPPSYDDALVPSTTSVFQPAPPPNKPNYDGYVLDASSPPFNPNVMPLMSMPTPDNNTDIPHNTSDYGLHDQDDYSNRPNAPLLSDTEANHNNTGDDDLFRGRPAPPGYSLYRAKYEIVRDGIISRDKHINQDGEALLQFLCQHNKPPRMKIHFYGYHEETVWVSQSTRNSDGELVEERVPSTRRIDDFEFDIDCSDNISNVCQGIYILPNPKTGEQKTLRQLCDEYCHSKNKLKELKLTKQVDWDYNGLTRALTSAIRDSGFYEHVEITYVMENHEIVVKTDYSISRWVDNRWIKLALILSCLWIIVYPLVWLFKKKFGHSDLKSAWNMNISERDWYGLHIQDVISSCRGNYITGGRFFKKRPSSYSVNMKL
ncbi:hypothetical protein V8B55DRAFT_1461420 [Mucor lusitanicus]|uniref:Uncharacterized protein n=2 Tax=Mucor circinelloides f. lusitanicus TaxID=29924 RepID=A0A162QZ24_MUCCL|nr:hypothetical protein FB192DRAFT_1432300 [Mucor lusitanicus]OAD02609.1 hypothetical protein MUCCIDRAFT_190170 [Mucor lusitanicus CBS 277.49]